MNVDVLAVMEDAEIDAEQVWGKTHHQVASRVIARLAVAELIDAVWTALQNSPVLSDQQIADGHPSVIYCGDMARLRSAVVRVGGGE